VEYLIEEAYEVVDSIEAGDSPARDEELRGELGDVLLQVVLHARLAEERGSFDFDAVARGINAKMVRRNPHVFKPDGSLQATFPATVMLENGRGIWKLRASPSRVRRYGGRRVISVPSKRMAPASLNKAPQMQLISVVLPEPFGPMMPRRSPVRTVRLTCESATKPPKRLLRPSVSITKRAGPPARSECRR